MNIIKAIKTTKEVFLDVPLGTTSIWLKVNKKELLATLETITSDSCPLEDEIEIVTQYGTSALYLAKKLA